MTAGRELNALVAKKVMGLRRPRPYSSEMGAAWEVVEELRAALNPGEYCFELQDVGDSELGGPWHASFLTLADGWVRRYGDTAPHAICLAALAAVGAEVLT